MSVPGFVAVPAVDWIWTVCAKAIFRDLTLPAGSVIELDESHSGIDAKRNYLVSKFLNRTELQWICFIDSDMLPPADAIQRLLQHGKPVISASCFRRLTPYAAAYGRRTGTGTAPSEAHWYTPDEVRSLSRRPDPVISVDVCGAGFLMIQRDVLAAMGDPWFKCWDDHPGSGEDIHFCDRLRSGKFAEVHVDTSLSVGHMGVVAIDLDSAARLVRPLPE